MRYSTLIAALHITGLTLASPVLSSRDVILTPPSNQGVPPSIDARDIARREPIEPLIVTEIQTAEHGLDASGLQKRTLQGCRQIRLTIRYINQINQFKSDMEFCQINQFKYNVCTFDISEWRAATLDTPDYPPGTLNIQLRLNTGSSYRATYNGLAIIVHIFYDLAVNHAVFYWNIDGTNPAPGQLTFGFKDLSTNLGIPARAYTHDTRYNLGSGFKQDDIINIFK
ncbi:hypothetical protein FOMG_19183 [Fusarium oxysporum f. sp. melonis 26406]|uniref:Uncharacterized protein n=1 Tax=Fusarium oxysporum f. sp. melonis 26406 TaxID=1089452 RepID=W9YX12_FUSOX|nr:hypothetical protein FOMG_19183 [Fusarium oxysporum f. sp. melonis 26406]